MSIIVFSYWVSFNLFNVYFQTFQISSKNVKIVKNVSGQILGAYKAGQEEAAILWKTVLRRVKKRNIVTLHHVQIQATAICHSIVLKKVVILGGLYSERKRTEVYP